MDLACSEEVVWENGPVNSEFALLMLLFSCFVLHMIITENCG